ncbi:class I SAM-dependent methyltransferase [Prosthecomicrobium sp. N25]|uniref:class I SAM-dependent methyltransferase n=1 Tax=Prosthecomicrobium sp. N25 TaxID=3129254 RepID=UPI0030780A74
MNPDALFEYQVDFRNYVEAARVPYNILASNVKEHLGGFGGKLILDLGVGFQLTHGGLTLALALLDGARQCYGIDIAHPDLHAADPNKVAFWKQARDLLGIEVQGLEGGRVVFASTDILHFDDFYSKITLLQMSASEIYFKDNMFDIVISNAVFEHVQNPKRVLTELYRVLKPGGGAAINWNPYAGFRMGGHDIGMPYHYPWAHLRLPEDRHVEMLGQVFSNPALYSTAFPPQHTPTPERAAIYAKDPALFRKQISYDLNKMRIPEFLDYAHSAGFELLSSVPHIPDEDRRFLTPEILAELSQYGEDELLQLFHTAVLRKPAG